MDNPAEGYERYMVPHLFGPWADSLVDAAAPKLGERVLDVGCGTGIVGRRVARRLGPRAEVTGIDPSAGMLAVAAEAARREAARVAWREGRAERLPFADGSFDLVLSAFALMFFDDRMAALAEMRRVAAADGRVLLSVWQGLDEHPFYRTLHEAIDRRVGISALQMIFALGDAEALRTLTREAGFARVDIEPMSKTARFPDPAAFLAGEIDVDTAAIPSMQHLDEQARREIVEAIAADMRGPLGGVTRGDEVVLPFHGYLVRASS